MAAPTYTLQERIEDVIGTAPTSGLTEALDAFCAQEARVLMGALPAGLLSRAASRSLVSGSEGLASANKRILRVMRGGYAATEVDPAMEALVTDTGSLNFASTRTPVYFERVNSTETRLYVKPDPTSTYEAQVDYVGYPDSNDIDASLNTSVTGIPREAEEALILGAGLRALARALSTVRAALPSLAAQTESLPTAPTAVTYPSFTDLSATLALLDTATRAYGSVSLSVPTVPTAITLPAVTVNLTSALADVASAVGDGVEDPDLADAALRNVQAILSELGAEVEAYSTAERTQMSRFTDQVQAYVTEIQGLVADYNAEIQGYDAYLAAETRTYVQEVQALVQRAAREHNDYLAKLQVYAQESQVQVQRYAAETQTVLADLQALGAQIQSVQQRYARELQRLGGDTAGLPFENRQAEVV